MLYAPKSTLASNKKDTRKRAFLDLDFVLPRPMLRGKLIQGKEVFAKALEQTKKEKAIQLTVHHVATHGKAGTVNGTRKLKNGKIYVFCEVYIFSNAKAVAVKEITFYIIETH
jgi:hypothetical protein